MLPLVAGPFGGSPFLFDPRAAFPDLTRLEVTGGFEETAAQAGIALFRAQTVAARAKRKADKLGGYGGEHGNDLDFHREREFREWSKQIVDVRNLIENALQDARDAKDKVFGAALAGGQFDKVRKDVEGAQTSFDEAEELVDEANEQYKAQDYSGLNKKLEDAAKKVKDDLLKLKAAAAKLRTPSKK